MKFVPVSWDESHSTGDFKVDLLMAKKPQLSKSSCVHIRYDIVHGCALRGTRSEELLEVLGIWEHGTQEGLCSQVISVLAERESTREIILNYLDFCIDHSAHRHE
jgi:hypothetical protein